MRLLVVKSAFRPIVSTHSSNEKLTLMDRSQGRQDLNSVFVPMRVSTVKSRVNCAMLAIS